MDVLTDEHAEHWCRAMLLTLVRPGNGRLPYLSSGSDCCLVTQMPERGLQRVALAYGLLMASTTDGEEASFP